MWRGAGSGAFGKVYRCICRKTLQPYAVKVIPKRRIFSLGRASTSPSPLTPHPSCDKDRKLQVLVPPCPLWATGGPLPSSGA